MPVANLASRRRKTAKATATTAAQVDARIDGHEDLCAERFRNLDNKVDDVKEDVKQLRHDLEQGLQTLNDAAKKAIDALGARQEIYHQSNHGTLGDLTDGLAELTVQVASGKGSFDGMSGALRFILQIIVPIGVSIATLIIVATKH